jgi:recombination protein RecR
MEFSSKLIENAVNDFAKLPGVGRKTALRFVLYLLRNDESISKSFSESVLKLRTEIKFCKRCHTISDQELCGICSNPARDEKTLCVVQDIRDVMAIENTQLYRGHYHVLGGIISPMEGIGPEHLTISSLTEKVASGKIEEVILALNATMEGETTCFYIHKKLAGHSVNITTIARGISVGDELEYADEITLGRSIQQRIPYQGTVLSGSRS